MQVKKRTQQMSVHRHDSYFFKYFFVVKRTPLLLLVWNGCLERILVQGMDCMFLCVLV